MTNYVESPLTLLAILAVLIGVTVLIVYLVKSYTKVPPQFKGSVLGHVKETDIQTIVENLLNIQPGQVATFVIVDKEEYVNKNGQMLTACQISTSLLNGSNPEDIYNNFIKKNQNIVAKKQDLGGIVMTAINNDAIDVFASSATNINEKPVVYKKTFLVSAANYLANVIRQFYEQFQITMPDALVVVINPVSKPSTPIVDDITTTPIPDDGLTNIDNLISSEEDPSENFGMYTGSLASWLKTHPSGSSVDRYTKKGLPTVQNINSVNNPVPAEMTGTSIPVDLSNRFQSPQQYATETTDQSYFY